MGPLQGGLAIAGVSMLLVATSVASAQDGDALVAQGKRLFEERGCYGCHAIAGKGATAAPDLTDLGRRYSLAYLTYWLRETPPRGSVEHMPKIALTEPEVQALAAYLSSLRVF
ncbi:MAG TPA: cytochrome c [Candidatus Nitrosotalea sp.]|nr:cytochrome c [Candidatus Nitrosotalea sp.]